MKRLVILVVAAGLLWSGYWYVAARGARAGYTAWFEARRAEGWQADYADLAVRGFPNRIDTTFDHPALADPETGLAWSAPFFQIFALSYKPHHIIAAWPHTQSFATPLGKYEVTSDGMRASLVMRPKPSLPVDRANLVAGAMTITPSQGGVTTLTGFQMALNRAEGDAAEYRLALNADGFAPPPPQGLLLHRQGALPDRLDALRADLTVEFDRPWDITALERARPQPTRLTLKLAEAAWGQLSLKLAGTLDINAQGQPSGRITVKAENWRDILDLVRAAGWLPGTVADTFEDGLALAAQLSGNPNTLDLPLDFARGRVSLGPIPLGAAPLFHLR